MTVGLLRRGDGRHEGIPFSLLDHCFEEASPHVVRTRKQLWSSQHQGSLLEGI